MVAVAIAALLMYGRRAQQHRLSLAALCGAADRGVRLTGAVYRLDIDTETLRTVTPETPARTPAEIEGRRHRSAYWIGLKQKYDRAAFPWLPIAPDPPEPE
jgi:hypothetical protein